MSEGDEESSDSSSLRPKDFVSIYFDFNDTTGQSKCKIGECNKVYKGRHIANLERHILQKHDDEAAIITKYRMKLKQERGQKKVSSENEKACEIPADPSETNKIIYKNKKVCIKIDKKCLLSACVELVTVNGRSFRIFDDSGFRKILDPILKGLENNGEKLIINRQNIPKEVVLEAERMRDKIKADIQGRLVSVKVDNATRLNRSIMGINIQYCKNDRIVLKNICTKEIYSSHTSENLKKEILLELEKVGIKSNMIYSFTTDNAANMLRTIKLVNSENCEMFSDSNSDIENIDVEDGSNYEYDTEEDMEVEKSNEEIQNESEQNSNILENSFDHLPKEFATESIFGQRCVAHTLQLAVDNAIKEANLTILLDIITSLVKKLRTQTVAGILSILKLKKPLIDCKTRWHSTFDMLESLLPFENMPNQVLLMLKKSKQQLLTENQWTELKDIIKALKPAKIATKKLQAENLQVGNCIEIWLRCKHETKEIDNPLAQILFAFMEKRELDIFASPAIACALYLDPRWQVMLSADQQKAAVLYLTHIWKRLQSLKQDQNLDMEYETTAEREEAEILPDKIDDPLEILLQERQKTERCSSNQRVEEYSIREALLKFSSTERINYSQNIFIYWKNKKFNQPELYELAQTVLGLPVTQVSVERLFSHLKFILNYLRTNIGPSLLNDILFVRCNRIFSKEKIQNIN